MSLSPVRTTICLEPHIQQALAEKARSNGLTISEVVDDAVRNMLHEDDLSIPTFSTQAREPLRGLDKQH